MAPGEGKIRQGPFEVELADSAIVPDALNAAAGATSFSLEIEAPLVPSTIAGSPEPKQRISKKQLTQKQGKVVNLFAPNPTEPSEETEQVSNTQSEQPAQQAEASNLPVRNYDCDNYATCLGLAAALDWSSFSCKGCSGNVDDRLLWRAHHRVRQNKALQSLCNLPILQND